MKKDSYVNQMNNIRFSVINKFIILSLDNSIFGHNYMYNQWTYTGNITDISNIQPVDIYW